MNAKKVKEVMDENLIVQNINLKCKNSTNPKDVMTITNFTIGGFETVKHYLQLFILSYKIIIEVVKHNADERRIPIIEPLNNDSDLYLLYNCFIMLFDKYPSKIFNLKKFKFDKKLPYFIYEVNIYKKNKTKYLIFSYEKDEGEPFWFYLMDNKTELKEFIKENLLTF